MEQQLSGRQNTILKLVVQEYVRTGRAVGSKALTERFQLGVSSATVRNEMGELEGREYLHHPYTSAGRVPTDHGYRYYVEYLLGDPYLPVSEQVMIRRQFRQVEMQIESWIKLAAAVLADACGNVSLVTPPRSRVERLRHFELISLRKQVALLILVTQAGAVHESILHLSEPVDQSTLSILSRRLNTEVCNFRHTQVARAADAATGLPALVLRQIAEALQAREQQSRSEIHHEGLDRALQQPEFSRGAGAQHLLELLHGGAILSALLPQLDLMDDVQIFIGSENRSADLSGFGVVIASYGASDEITGYLAVLGPTRMPYGRSISMVRYLALVLSDLLREIYQAGPEAAR